jgi:hypothetical protein
VDDAALPTLRDDHGRLKWRVADALLGYCGAERRAFRSLCKAYLKLRGHVQRMRRELYPVLYRAMPAGVLALVGESMLHWLEANRRGPAPTPAGLVRRRRALATRPPARLDLSRIPTLHHVVEGPPAAAAGRWAQ